MIIPDIRAKVQMHWANINTIHTCREFITIGRHRQSSHTNGEDVSSSLANCIYCQCNMRSLTLWKNQAGGLASTQGDISQVWIPTRILNRRSRSSRKGAYSWKQLVCYASLHKVGRHNAQVTSASGPSMQSEVGKRTSRGVDVSSSFSNCNYCQCNMRSLTLWKIKQEVLPPLSATFPRFGYLPGL